jgi:F0F1-type ATP synthase membrane subunit c/vacuolar-type H+-ATPase subunit K
MYIRRKLYSNIDGEYVPVEQTVLFSAKDDAKGAAIGAGVAAGAAGIGAAGLYGAKKAADKAVSKAVENKNAILAGKIAGDFEKAEAKHEAASTARNKINKIIDSTKGWLTNAEGKEAAKAYEKTIAGKSGAAKEEMIKKLARLNKAAGNTALKRQLGVGAAILGTGAAVGAGVAHLKGKKKAEEEKAYSVLMTEDELALFSEIQKEFGLKEVLQKIAETPEAKRMISTAKTSGQRMGLKYANAIKGLADESMRNYELNSGVYAESLGGLLKRGARNASKGLKKAANEVSRDASKARKEIKKTSAADIVRHM